MFLSLATTGPPPITIDCSSEHMLDTLYYGTERHVQNHFKVFKSLTPSVQSFETLN